MDDAVDGILATLDHPSGYQIYNLGNRRPVALRDTVRSIEAALRGEVVLDRQPDQPGDVPVTSANIRKAAEQLGYAPKVSFEPGVRRFVECYRNAGIPL